MTGYGRYVGWLAICMSTNLTIMTYYYRHSHPVMSESDAFLTIRSDPFWMTDFLDVSSSPLRHVIYPLPVWPASLSLVLTANF